MARNLGDKNLNDRERLAKAQLATIEAKFQAKLTAKEVIIKRKDLLIKTLKAEIKKLKES